MDGFTLWSSSQSLFNISEGLSFSPVFSNTKRWGASHSLKSYFSPFHQLSSRSLSLHGPGLLPTFSYVSGPIFLLFTYLILPHRTWSLGWPRKKAICKVVEIKKLRRQKPKSFSRWNLKMLIFFCSLSCVLHCLSASNKSHVSCCFRVLGLCFFFFFFYSSTVDLHYYIKFMCTTVIQYFDRLYSIYLCCVSVLCIVVCIS